MAEESGPARAIIRASMGAERAFFGVVAMAADGASAATQIAPAQIARGRKCHSRGLEHARAGHWREALRAFEDATRCAPNQAGYQYARGVALCRLDRFQDAIDAFRLELLVTPEHAQSLAEIGTCLARTGRPREGIPFLQRGLSRNANLPLAQYSLGLALLNVNRREEAIEALDRALRLDGVYADAYRTRALAFVMNGEYDKAADDMQAAAALDSENFRALIELGVNFGKEAREQQAGRLFEMAAKLAPNEALSQYMFGQFLINHRSFQLGLEHIERAIALDPLRPEPYVSRGFGLLGQGRIEEAVVAYRHAGSLNPASAEIAGTLLFALQHKPGVTKRELLEAHRNWGALYRVAPRDRLDFTNEPKPARKPRIGLVSADFHRHAAAYLTLRAFEQLAAFGYEIYCYKTDKKREDDDFSERYKASARFWRDVSGLDDDALADLIGEHEIDILFDLAGHTAGNRLSLFARRAAPIQLSWAGYVGTIGLDTYDGLIADPIEAPAEDDEFYMEPVIRLPDCYVCYHPPTDPPDVAPLPASEKDVFTFGCFNRPAKLNAEVARAWARIVDGVPGSRILLVYGGLNETATRDALYRIFENAGLSRQRVELVGETEQSKLLEAYGQIDLALDPFPYSGGVTTLEAMWMGVPTVTFVGDTFAGRHSATHLTAAGLAEFCCRSVDEYVASAVRWSSALDELASLRAGLRDRVAASPLNDQLRFGQNLSNELLRLWREWCSIPREGDLSSRAHASGSPAENISHSSVAR